MKFTFFGFIATVFLAMAPAYSSYSAENPPDPSHKTVAESAKELGHAVKRDAKAVGKAVKEGARQVGSAAKSTAKKVKDAVKKD